MYEDDVQRGRGPNLKESSTIIPFRVTGASERVTECISDQMDGSDSSPAVQNDQERRVEGHAHPSLVMSCLTRCLTPQNKLAK
ncbi:hypothetical protein JTE90_000707 [Oedothorax gibbosus]|uniref:Uncharacterized protein n=1 Tax=Oedothorax gibbosus TaxID=931172 RepID=A0AAV6UPM1_9ARAC|nr:hypothetical protein JTE90_000707 [Oedothorax gibbosus]